MDLATFLRPKLFLLLGLLAMVTPACSEDVLPTGTTTPAGTTAPAATAPVNLTFMASSAAKATGTNALVVPGGDAVGHAVTLSDFQVSIRDVKFKQEGEDSTALDTGEVEISGPFAIDMLNGDVAVAQVLGDAVIPPGVYDGIRFVLHKSAENIPALLDRSVYIAGTVERGSGAENFVMWHDTGENFDLAGTNGLTIDDGVPNDLIVDFKLVSIISAVDFTNADLTEDISPRATSEANKVLADALKEGIKAAADFGEDEDGSGEIEEDEDVD